MSSVPTVQVCFTMDVERLAAKSPTGGPDNLQTSRQAILGYCDLLRKHGFPATLFITPDAAEENRDALLKVAGWGVELGLHLHPQSWRDNYLQPERHDYLGGYTQSEQEHMLRDACAQWAASLGQQPLAVRPGNFSANDGTYSAMLAAGFRCGSVSQPGRRLPTYHATWVGACPEIHYPHRADRLLPGNLDFVEVPLTFDRSAADHWTGVGDIRIEDADEDYISYVCRREVARQLDESVLLPHLCLFTHNLYDYSSEERGQGHLRPRLAVVIERLQAMGDAVGVEITGATIADASSRFRTLSSAS